MKLEKNGVNLLLVGEVLLLIVVLVVGLVSGASGAIKDLTGDSENDIVINTENNWKPSGTEDDEQPSGTESKDDDYTWTVPESYTDGQIKFSGTVEDMLSNMNTEQKVAQLFAVTPETLTGYDQVTVFGNASKSAYDKYPVGALIYSVHNYQNNAQMKALVEGARTYSKDVYGRDLWTIMVEPEGTSLQVRIDDANNYGMNLILGGTDDVETIKATNLASGAGVFPGGQSVAGATLLDLNNGALVSFSNCIKTGSTIIIISNTPVAAITDDDRVPCSLSSRTVGLIRQSMGYNGVLMTEDFSQEGFVSTYGGSQACVEAIKAGMDMIYNPANFTESYNAVLEAVKNGNISEERLHNAVGRILTAKGV